jgi:hypothetical protein
MSILGFRDRLVSVMATALVPADITNETTFEKRFLIPVVLQVSAECPGVRTYTHPWNNKTRCEPDCEKAPDLDRVVAGCPRCWAASKAWASVSAFGTHHAFDIVARDMSGKTLVVEAKLIVAKGGRMPNSEIQRLVGQCFLAKTKHDFVIGVCGLRGSLDPRWTNDTEVVRLWFERAGVDLVFRSVG